MREGEHTVAFQLPGAEPQLMLDDVPGWGGARPMYLVEDVDAWIAAKDATATRISDIPRGKVAQIEAPGHHCFVFEMHD